MLRWTTVEYREVARSTDWYWGLALIGLAGATLAFVYNNFLFGIVIVIGVGMIFYKSLLLPPAIEVEISERGIRINNELFPIGNLVSFSIEEGRDARLMVLTRGMLSSSLAILLGEVATGAVREALAPLPERAWKPSLLDAIGEYLGF